MACSTQDHAALLRTFFDCAIDAVSASRVLPRHLPPQPSGRTVLLAVGKAAAAMSEVVVAQWDGPLSGLVVTPYGYATDSIKRYPDIELIEAGHPIPDDHSVLAARRALELVHEMTEDDLVLVLISGGGSALWCLPIESITLQHKQRITHELLNAGASINELNTVRKWLSRIKGGKLAEAAAPARVETLIISDVVRNNAGVIASGPTIPRSETFGEFEEILARYRIELPSSVRDALRKEMSAAKHRLGGDNGCRIVAVPTDALEAAEAKAAECGFNVRVLGDAIEGEARQAATAHARIARQVKDSGLPTVILSGGEVTVAVRNESGIGGPNTEFLLALAVELDGLRDVYAMACDTDGCDGIGENAGAVIGPDTLERARRLNLDPLASLNGNDSSRFFRTLGDLVITGPTQTNVSDFRAIMVCSGHARRQAGEPDERQHPTGQPARRT